MKLKTGLKRHFKFYLIILVSNFLNSNKLYSIELAALQMGLAGCIGIFKELKTKNLLDKRKN